MSDADCDPLPCPFCAETPEIAKHFREEMWRLSHQCCVIGPITLGWCDTVDALLKQWNTRKCLTPISPK